MGKNIINIALFGLGRIGQMHANNLINHKDFNLKYIFDKDQKLTKKLSKKIKMDDNAQVMINFNNGAKGMFWTSVMAKGGVYGLRIRVFGSKGSMEWVQNDPNYLKLNPEKGAVKL